MNWFKHAALRQKLTWLAMICSIVALATTAVALGVYEWFAYRRTAVAHLITLTTLTARNTRQRLRLPTPMTPGGSSVRSRPNRR